MRISTRNLPFQGLLSSSQCHQSPQEWCFQVSNEISIIGCGSKSTCQNLPKKQRNKRSLPKHNFPRSSKYSTHGSVMSAANPDLQGLLPLAFPKVWALSQLLSQAVGHSRIVGRLSWDTDRWRLPPKYQDRHTTVVVSDLVETVACQRNAL